MRSPAFPNPNAGAPLQFVAAAADAADAAATNAAAIPMNELADRQLSVLEKLQLRDCSHMADDGSKVLRTVSAFSPPPFGTGVARCSPSGTFAHNDPARLFGALPNRGWKTPRAKEVEDPRALQQVASSSRQANNAPNRQQQQRRPTSAGASASLPRDHVLALRKEVAAIRRSKELQREGPESPRAAAMDARRPMPTTQWLYSLDGQSVDALVEWEER